MGIVIKTFWISLACLLGIGIVVLGIVGIPAKPVPVVRTVPNDRLPQ